MSYEIYPYFVKVMLILTLLGSITFLAMALYYYFNNKNNFLTNKITITALFLTLILTLLKLTFNITPINIINKIIPFTPYIKKGILTIILAVILFKIFKKIKRVLERKNDKFLEQIKEIKEQKIRQPWQTDPRITKIMNLTYNKPKLAQKYEEEIEEIITQLRNELKTIENKEKEKKEYEEREQQTQEQNQQRTQKLLNHYISQESTKTPEWATHYDPALVRKAQEQYEQHKRRIKEEKDRKETDEEETRQIGKYILEHKSYPSNYHWLNEKTQEKYKKALELHKQGKLIIKEPEPEIKIEELEPELAKNKVYPMTDLPTETKKKLIKAGYRKILGKFIDGSAGNNLLVKNDNKRESDYHFYMKHLFAEVDSKYAKIEAGNGDLRADVSFTYPAGNIAIEIETGTNKKEQLEKKKEWLDQNFTYWIIICPKKMKPIYKEYTDNKKSFALRLGEGSRKLDELKHGLTEVY